MTGGAIRDTRPGNLEIAEAIAPTWERRRGSIEDITTPVREWMLRELAARPGETVLELAAGVGDTGFEAASALGDEGRLICTDLSPAMVDAARRRGADLGIGNVDYRVMDAERLELDDDSVDAVLCRYGYMLMEDSAAALAETRRVLRPGGRLVLAVWGAPERNPFFAIVAMALVQRGHIPPPEPQGPGIFSMASEDLTRAALQSAGFETVRTEQVRVEFSMSSPRDYLDFVADTAGPIAFALRGVGEADRAALESQVGEALAPFARDGAYEIPGVAIVAVAS